MIPEIQEIGFGPGTAKSYATLHQATVSLQEMGERTISTQVRIDGDVVPNFTGWELMFKGERFVMPSAVPQASKDNTTRNALVDLNFTSWIILELKRYYFMSLSQIDAGTAIADKYKASVILPLKQFVELFNRVLKYYFGDTVRMDLFQPDIYSTTPVSVEIDYTHIWDVLLKFYELFKVRWTIAVENGVYVIKVGYAADSIDDHDFEYGYEGGLLRFERQVQDEDITNILLGRGGEKNLPYRYFKQQDPQNPEWTEDPDAIPELANIYFDRLRDAAFRWYVRGWMQNPNRDTSWDATHTFPTYSDVPEEYQYAYNRGRTDAKFNPVEFAKDDDSIAKYGERWGALDDNDDIYPTIQGVIRDPMGRVDEVIAVSDIITDDIEAASKEASTVREINGTTTITNNFGVQEQKTDILKTEEFTIPSGSTGNLHWTWLNPRTQGGAGVSAIGLNTGAGAITAVNVNTGVEYAPDGLPSGTYYAKITLNARNYNTYVGYNNVTYGLDSLSLEVSVINTETWKPTFDIWVKNIWETTQGQGESDEQYAARVWEKILGDRVGNEAKIVFSDGFMSISEDYEFQIASYPVVDRSKTFIDSEGNTYQSEWKITLRKSDAEFEATGLFIPNASASGKPRAGDHFFFIGIDMPFQYVEWAEEQVHASKLESLQGTSDINPTWVINLDKVRVHTVEEADYGTALADRLAAGATVWIKDKRFTPGERLQLFVQSITYTWNEPSDGSPYLVPDIEVVLSDKVNASEGVVQKLQGSVDVIRSTYAKTSDLEAVVRRVATPLFLKKTGENDSSESPTTFSSKLSSKNFRQGDIGGAGWGFYRDGDDESVLELDKVVVRHEMRVNNLVSNQISYVGGKQITSAASIECTQVVDATEGYYCYFDQKQGTVANLFVVGDFAMVQDFNPENVELRYYRARVDAVGLNYILLSKTVTDGDGEPKEGDTIIQYGNESVAARQYVIIRDVIGGGYERMLSDLNSVNAAGKEYYFAGRVSGQSPRWFVGDSLGEYAEWVNGRLNIKGTLIIRNADGSYQAMTDYMESVQRQIDGQIQSWSSGQSQTPQTEPYPQVVDDVVDPTTANFPASSWALDTDREQHFGDIYVDDSTGQGYRYTKRVKNGVTEYYWTRITDEEVAEAMRLAQLANTRVDGLEYLKEATNNGTTLVDGGLILSNLMALGQTINQQFQVNAGINGIMNAGRTRLGGGIAAWFGGDISDKDDLDQGVTAYAKSLFRFDGSGYLAGGNIHWDSAGYGGIPGITWSGNDIIIGGNVKLASLTGDSVTELVTLVRALSNMFIDEEYTEGGQTKHRIKVNPSFTGFYAEGFISAGGVGSSSGGGGDIDLPRVWESLTNNTDFPDVTINPAHIPDMENVYGYLKGNQTITLTGVVTGSGTTSIVTSIADGALSIAKVAGLQSALNAKQDTIGDLATIRSRANEGHAIYGYFTNGVLGLAHIPLDDRLSYVDPEAGEDITIDDPGVTGTVLWGAESANQVALDVNGVSKTLVKMQALDGIRSSITTILGYFSGGAAYNALALEGHNSSYFATATGLNNLATTVAGLVTGVSSVAGKTGAVSLVIGDVSGLTEALAGKQAAGNYVNTIGGAYGAITLGAGLTMSGNQLSVTGQTQGTVTRVDVGSTQYSPSAAGVVSLPPYPVIPTAVSAFTNDAGYLTAITSAMVTVALGYTPFNSASFTKANIQSTLGISDWALAETKPSYTLDEVSDGSTRKLSDYFLASNFTKANIQSTLGISNWALESAKPSYTFSDIGSKPTTLAGYGITDAKFSSAGVADKIRITLGSNYHDVLTAHQSLSGYATEAWVGQQGFITKAVNDLTNYYLKSQTYTQAEVNALIAAINQFHYEVYPSTSSVTDPQSNVLYLIGPTGSGSDKYEEYVYPNATTGWTKIGDTSIDLSPYLLASVAAQTYVPLTRTVNGHALSSDVTVTKGDVGLGKVDNLAASGYFTEFANGTGSDANKVLITIGGTQKKLTVDYASNADTLDSHDSSYFGKASDVSTLQRYFTNGVANSAARLSGTSAYSIWGVEYWANGVPKSVTGIPNLYIGTTQVQTASQSQNLAGIGTIAASGLATIQGGISLGGQFVNSESQSVDSKLVWDATNNAWHLIGNFYADGFITAGGVGSSSGGGGDIDLPRVWESLTNNTDFPNVTINPAHIPDMATIYGYLKGNQTITLTGVVTGSGTTSIATSIADGALSIAKTNGLQAALNAKQDTISDLSTIRTRSNEGHTVYGYFTNGVLGLAHVPLDDRLSYVDPEAGEDITIDDPGTTGTVLWGAESANNVALDVNGVSKMLVKQAAMDGVYSSISSLSALIGTKQDYISDLSSIRSNASLGATAYGWGDHRQAGYLTSVPTASAQTLGVVKVGNGLRIDDGVLSVTGQTQGTVTRVDVGSTQYAPDTNGVVGLPAYPTTLPASDVYAWAKKSSLDVNDIPSIPNTKVTGLGTAATRGVATTIGSSITNLVPGSLLYGVLGDAFDSTNTVKAFINSSISTATATFRGTNDVATTEGEFLTWANALTHDLNDYVFWGTIDSVGNTVYKRYKYNGTSWAFEYDLNNSSFTSAQWSAINSGITSSLVTKLNGIAEGAQVNVIESVKVNGTALSVANKAVDITAIPLSIVTGADDLKAIEGLTATSGYLKKTAANTWSLVTNLTDVTAINTNYLQFNNNSITVGKNLIPAANTKLGDEGAEWSSVYATNAIFDNLTVGGMIEVWYDTYGQGRIMIDDEISLKVSTHYGFVNIADDGIEICHDYSGSIYLSNPTSVVGSLSISKSNNVSELLFENDFYIRNNNGSFVSNLSAVGTITTGVWHGSKIEKAYLADAVQTSLGKADTALQSHQAIYGLTINNSAGTAVLSYNPKTAAGSLTLTKAMVGLGNVENFVYNVPTGAEQTYTYPV